MSLREEEKDVRLRNLARRHQTPLYVYDGEQIEAQYNRLAAALPTGFEIFYSVKCNPLLSVCELLCKAGSRAEVASAGELHVALQAGFKPQDIIWTSPGKSADDLVGAIEAGIYSINVESLEEARLLSSLASARDAQVQVSVRINPDFQPTGAGLKMTGVPSPFGIDQPQAVDALREIAALPGLTLIGLHVFTGSQVLDASVLVHVMEQIMELAVALSAESGFVLQFLDLGGGFGIPYFPGELPFDTAVLQSGLQELWQRMKGHFPGVRMGVESGRFLLAESGVYLTEVLYVKSCKGVTFAVCDGGSHQHASSAFLGRYVRNNFPMRLLQAEEAVAGGKGATVEQTEGAEEESVAELALMEVNVVGPLCTPTDVIGQRVRLPQPVAGDLVVVERSGAYGLTHSPTMFLSHPFPAEVLCYQGKEQIVRERGTADGFLRGQKGLLHEETSRASYVF
jgi:diaminopimelate decarboxylase